MLMCFVEIERLFLFVREVEVLDLDKGVSLWLIG